jgi:hypothetical protein
MLAIFLPGPFPRVRHRLHSPRSRRVHACAPVAAVNGRPTGRPAQRGRLDGRVIRGATIEGFRLGFRTGVNSPLVCRKAFLATFVGLCFPPPLCRRSRRRERVLRRVFNSPQLARTIGRVFNTSPRAPRRAPDRTAQPADPAPPVEPRPGRGETARSAAGAKDRRHATWRPEATTQERPPALPLRTPWRWRVWQSGGAGSGGKPDKAGANCEAPISTYRQSNSEKGTNQAYPPCTLLLARTIGRPCSIARSHHVRPF